MFDAPYAYNNLGRETPTGELTVERRLYKFTAKHRVYLVLLETLDIGVVAIKYCDRSDYIVRSRKAYTKIFDQKDSDAIRVISTCLHIMAAHWKKNPNISFVFLASFRNIPPHIALRRNFSANPVLAEQYRQSRFNIYKYAMFNLFDPEKFNHLYDSKNCIYLLLNYNANNPTLIQNNLMAYLSSHCDLLFDDV